MLLAQQEASAVDCDVAADLRDRICELAERICAIAAENPDDALLETQCKSGRAACDRARQNVSVGCGDD